MKSSYQVRELSSRKIPKTQAFSENSNPENPCGGEWNSYELTLPGFPYAPEFTRGAIVNHLVATFSEFSPKYEEFNGDSLVGVARVFQAVKAVAMPDCLQGDSLNYGSFRLDAEGLAGRINLGLDELFEILVYNIYNARAALHRAYLNELGGGYPLVEAIAICEQIVFRDLGQVAPVKSAWQSLMYDEYDPKDSNARATPDIAA